MNYWCFQKRYSVCLPSLFGDQILCFLPIKNTKKCCNICATTTHLSPTENEYFYITYMTMIWAQWPHSEAFYLYLTFEFELKQGLSLFIHFLTDHLSSRGLPLRPAVFQHWLCVHGPSFKFNYFMKCHWAKSGCWSGDTPRDCSQVQPCEMSFSHQMPMPSCTVKKIRALTSTFPLTWESKSHKVASKRFTPTFLSHRSAHVGCRGPCSVY